MIKVISSVLVHYLDSQTPPVQAELVGQEDRVIPDTYRGGRDSSVSMWSVHRGIYVTNQLVARLNCGDSSRYDNKINCQPTHRFQSH